MKEVTYAPPGNDPWIQSSCRGKRRLPLALLEDTPQQTASLTNISPPTQEAPAMRINVIKVGSPNTSIEVSDGATIGDLLAQLAELPEYQGNFQKFLNDVQISNSGEEGTYPPSQPLHEGDVVALTMKVKGGRQFIFGILVKG